jgi:hypothetical protein
MKMNFSEIHSYSLDRRYVHCMASAYNRTWQHSAEQCGRACTSMSPSRFEPAATVIVFMVRCIVADISVGN